MLAGIRRAWISITHPARAEPEKKRVPASHKGRPSFGPSFFRFSPHSIDPKRAHTHVLVDASLSACSTLSVCPRKMKRANLLRGVFFFIEGQGVHTFHNPTPPSPPCWPCLCLSAGGVLRHTSPPCCIQDTCGPKRGNRNVAAGNRNVAAGDQNVAAGNRNVAAGTRNLQTLRREPKRWAEKILSKQRLRGQDSRKAWPRAFVIQQHYFVRNLPFSACVLANNFSLG